MRSNGKGQIQLMQRTKPHATKYNTERLAEKMPSGLMLEVDEHREMDPAETWRKNQCVLFYIG